MNKENDTMKKNRIPSEADRRTIRAGRRYGALVLTVLGLRRLDLPRSGC